jgi:hypothetical protein
VTKKALLKIRLLQITNPKLPNTSNRIYLQQSSVVVAVVALTSVESRMVRLERTEGIETNRLTLPLPAIVVGASWTMSYVADAWAVEEAKGSHAR